MRRMLALLIVMTAGLMAVGPDNEVKEAEKKWATATTSNDFATLEKILGEELIYTHSTGVTDSKRVFIDNLKNNVRKYTSLDYESSEVKVIGNTALLTAKGRLKVTTNGQPTDSKISFLHVYLKRNGAWQLVGHQSARLQ